MALLCLGCSAQSSAPELDRRIEKQVRASFRIPAYVKVQVSPRKASEFPNYDAVNLDFISGEQKQTHEFLISKDGKTLISMTKLDLTKDPYAEVMEKIDIKGRPWRGAKDAKVVAVVYDDFQCPFCTRMHATIFNDVMKTYGDRVKVVYKDYPLFEIHPWAGRAAINSTCLAQQNNGAYWDLADYLHYNGKAVSGDKRPMENQFAELDRITMEFGKKHSVDLAKLQQCVKEQPSEALQASVKEAESVGVNATPAIFVNGIKLDGAVPAPELKAVIDQALRDVGEQAPAASMAAPAAGK
ncbi:MAG TPA: thioredoxin domain-containing protein [Clostridia bacterium]|nr:thioredoxin domain-containing protein [Clostridia bacterium]